MMSLRWHYYTVIGYAIGTLDLHSSPISCRETPDKLLADLVFAGLCMEFSQWRALCICILTLYLVLLEVHLCCTPEFGGSTRRSMHSRAPPSVPQSRIWRKEKSEFLWKIKKMGVWNVWTDRFSIFENCPEITNRSRISTAIFSVLTNNLAKCRSQSTTFPGCGNSTRGIVHDVTVQFDRQCLGFFALGEWSGPPVARAA